MKIEKRIILNDKETRKIFTDWANSRGYEVSDIDLVRFSREIKADGEVYDKLLTYECTIYVKTEEEI